MPTNDARPKAWLLIGPTGSGKSPLGGALERETGRAHLDFGALLRDVAAGERLRGLPGGDRARVGAVLAARALFEDADGPLVRRLLDRFLAENSARPGIVLNGIPRHEGQAEGFDALWRVTAVVLLEASAEVTYARIARRRRGESLDHAGRDDDALEDVRGKLALYAARTKPLVAWYAKRGVPVLQRIVSATQDEAQLAKELVRELELQEE